jgi:hypothetical protein
VLNGASGNPRLRGSNTLSSFRYVSWFQSIDDSGSRCGDCFAGYCIDRNEGPLPQLTFDGLALDSVA